MDFATCSEAARRQPWSDVWYDTHPTGPELAAELGPNWAICRNTPRNRAKYGNCLSRKRYEAACARIMSRRTKTEDCR